MLLCVLTATAYGAHRAMNRTHRTHGTSELYQFAQNPPWFKAALKRVHLTGGTIRLPAGRVAPLRLFDLTPGAPIRLLGRPSTKLSGITIKRSKDVVMSGFRMAPAGAAPAIADISGSSDITFRDVRFLGTQEDSGVALRLAPDDRDVTVAHAEFAHCQHGLACILAQGRGLVIDHVRFHDVRDADVIRGAANDVTISDSDLHDALAGTHSDNHNDLIQILGGGPWTIVRSHFGVRANGAAQVYVDPRSGPAGPVHDVHVESSLFTGSNKDMFFAINVRRPAQSSIPLATGVEFVNNTIVSANVAAIVLADEYAQVPSGQRPLVENNILGRQKHPLCGVARMVTNVIGSGVSCPGDRRGTPSLDGKGRPSTDSASLLAHGTAGAAPATDLYGRKRAHPPAVGAVELP